MKPFDVHQPESVDDALRLLRLFGPSARALAGGTDLLLENRSGLDSPDHLVSLTGVKGLLFITEDSHGLRIGATTTLMLIENSPLVRRRCEMLAEAAGMIGARQTRNLATLGGNVCNAVPSADTAPPLLASDAEAIAVSLEGRRRIPMAEFFLAPRSTTLQPGELLEAIVIPLPAPHSGCTYVRHTARKALDLAIVGVAVRIALDSAGDTVLEARVALGAVAPTPIRARDAEALLIGQAPTDRLFELAAEAAVGAARPISDLRASADYRSEMIRTLTRRCLGESLHRAQGQSDG